jgi:hypothetical protein
LPIVARRSSPDSLRVSAKIDEDRLPTPADFADVPSADPFEGYEAEEVEGPLFQAVGSSAWLLAAVGRRATPPLSHGSASGQVPMSGISIFADRETTNGA